MNKIKSDPWLLLVLRIVVVIAFLNSTSAFASMVKGTFSSSGSDFENFKISGWACQTGKNQSIQLHVFLGGKSGTGTLYKGITASLPSEQGVADACSNTLRKNRFSLQMPLTDIYKYRGKSIYIHGISTIGSGNSLLSNSGKYNIPNIPTSKIAGSVESLVKSGSDYYLRGWACQTSYKTPVDVQIFAGGASGSGGSRIATGKANTASSVSVASACKTSGTQYGFNIKIPADKVSSFATKKLYVHGISLINTGNPAIGNSGNISLPAKPVPSKVIGLLGTSGNDYENFKIEGWACQTGKNASIGAHIYFGGEAGSGTAYRSITASLPSEQGVKNACSNSWGKNRFNLLMPIADVYKYRGKSIYIHGISTIGSGNNLLGNSGKFNVPAIPTSNVIGSVEGLVNSGSDYYLRGWACQSNYKQPIDVQIYAGGASGSGGTRIATGKANGATTSGVASACKTAETKYGFNIKIPADKVAAHSNKPLYVHGISLINTGNSVLGSIGNVTLPSPGTRYVSYEYDALGRLVTHDASDRVTTYTYDDADNRETKKIQQK